MLPKAPMGVIHISQLGWSTRELFSAVSQLRVSASTTDHYKTKLLWPTDVVILNLSYQPGLETSETSSGLAVGVILTGLIEMEDRLTVNSIITWAGDSRFSEESQLSWSNHCFLLLSCGCSVTSWLLDAALSLPCHDGLGPGTLSQNKLLSLCYFCQGVLS